MLLATKLRRPISVHELVERPDLVRRLAAETKKQLTLICAPAGFGKSSLASQWLHKEDALKATWLSLDESDNDLRTFLAYLVTAIQRVDGSVGGITQSLLQSPQLPPVTALIAPLLSEIAESSETIVLVLDDYHIIESQEIHDILAYILAHQPPQLHIIMLTRTDPPLAIGRLRAQGELQEIRSTDLRFNKQEISAFFQSVMKIELSSDEVAALEARTEGWISGLQLAGLALQKQKDVSNFIQRFTGNHTYIVDYLGEEVLAQQPDDIYDFLLKTSILRRLHPALCDALLGQPSSQPMLDALHEANLFLISLDDERQWYRYHHLFSDFLQYQLKRIYPEELPNLHRRASQWHHENGDIDEAIYHALAGEDFTYAADIIEQHGVRIVSEIRYRQLASWIGALPQELAKDRPYLDVLLAWNSILTGRPQDAAVQLNSVEQAMQHTPDITAEAVSQLNLLQSYVARSRGDIVSTIERLDKAQEFLPKGYPFLECTVYLNVGINYWLMGDIAAAEEAFYRASVFRDQPKTEYPALAAAGFFANGYLQLGKIQQASDFCRRILETEYAQRDHPLPAIANVSTEYGAILYELNDLDGAEPILDDAIRLDNLMDQVLNPGRAMQLMALIKLAKGHLEEAKNYFNQANALFRDIRSVYQMIHQVEFEYLRVCFWLLRNDTTSAGRWAQAYEQTRHVENTWDILRELSFVRVLLAQEHPAKAMDVLEGCENWLQSASTQAWRIHHLILKARCFQALGREDDALEQLAQALSLAEPEGYNRSFLDEGVVMGNLLSALLARYDEFAQGHSFSADYASTLASIIRKEGQEVPGLIEPLTDRELDILRLLASGLTNPEIADELVISVGTVKQHNHAIFRKLDVQTRTQAADRAKELHLL